MALPGVVAFSPIGQPVSEEGWEFLARQQRWRDRGATRRFKQKTSGRQIVLYSWAKPSRGDGRRAAREAAAASWTTVRRGRRPREHLAACRCA